MNNTSKPTGSINNSTKPTIGLTWAEMTNTWEAETRTWDEVGQKIDNATRPAFRLVGGVPIGLLLTLTYKARTNLTFRNTPKP